ncbi:MAG: hypothetical protein ACRDPZ_01395 [Gaiellaceae bacterium]
MDALRKAVDRLPEREMIRLRQGSGASGRSRPMRFERLSLERELQELHVRAA